MIESLVTGPVAAADAFDDRVAAPLHPVEAAVVARSVPERRREFATVRLCARRALARLGLPYEPLVPDGRGAPQWPRGVVGSMTHTAGYRAAAVARASDVVSLGIDAEPDRPLGGGVLGTIALPQERRAVAALAARRPDVNWDRVLFSAKESVFKTWYPLTRRELDFDEAVVAIEPETGRFTARLLAEGPAALGPRPDPLVGRWLSRYGVIVTGVTVPAGPQR
ncbi:4'-phosphopantetheinyl transferase superfamily protein [Streptomyces sp. NPDC089919]|uniref:4'-phosphopantetheinyl transferase family protein n=1 Tax=Streptomyces sp. NPDC089919 TaxID=3155188 RepID=UPI003442181B